MKSKKTIIDQAWSFLEERDRKKAEENAWLEVFTHLSYKDLCILWERTPPEHLLKTDKFLKGKFQQALKDSFPIKEENN